MDDSSARAIFNRVLGEELDANGKKFDFDKVYHRLQNITLNAQKLLLKYSLEIRLKEIEKLYKRIWDKLRPNEQIAIISLYYNSPKLVNEKTQFFQHMHNYLNNNGDPSHFLLAIKEVKERSNPGTPDKEGWTGIQNRRETEARILNSTLCPHYIPANAEPNILSQIIIIPGESRVPRNLNAIHGINYNAPFYVWRTQLDAKVRKEHLAKEGMVFRKDDEANLPGIDPNCRCYSEPISNNLFIIEPANGFKSLDEFAKHNGQAQIVLNSWGLETIF